MSLGAGFETADEKGLVVEGGQAAFTYPCAADGAASLDGSATRLTVAGSGAGVALTNVSFTMTFQAAEFSGVFSGTIDAATAGEGLPASPPGGAGSEDTKSTVAFGYGAAFGGFFVGDVAVNALYRLSTTTASGMTFAVEGAIAFAYPCEDGDVVRGSATLAASVPGAMNISGLRVSVTYSCGALASDQPRFTASGGTDEGVTIAGITLNPLSVSADVFDGRDGDDGNVSALGGGHGGYEVSGSLSGSVQTSASGEWEVGADVLFAFDTRPSPASWQMKTGVSYVSERLNATAHFSSQGSGECDAAGTSGGGSVSIAFAPGLVSGSSTVQATATATKRCGSFAKSKGIFAMQASIAKAVVPLLGGDAVVTLTDVTLSLVSSGGGSTDNDTSTSTSVRFDELDWSGVAKADASLELLALHGGGDAHAHADGSTTSTPTPTSSAGLLAKISFSADLAFEVIRGDASFRSLSVTGELVYAGAHLALRANVRFEAPCTLSGELVELSFDGAAADSIASVTNVTGSVSYECGGKLSIAADAGSIEIAPALLLTDVSVRLVFEDAWDMVGRCRLTAG